MSFVSSFLEKLAVDKTVGRQYAAPQSRVAGRGVSGSVPGMMDVSKLSSRFALFRGVPRPYSAVWVRLHSWMTKYFGNPCLSFTEFVVVQTLAR